MDRVLLVGQSHANCVNAAVKARKGAGRKSDCAFEVVAHGADGLPGSYVVRNAAGDEMINPIVMKALKSGAAAAEPPRNWLVSMLAGNNAVQIGLFQGDDRWQTLLPGQDELLDDEARFIPYDVLASAIAKRLALFKRFLELVPKGLVHRFVHVDAPPPVRSNEYILEKMPAKIRAVASSLGLGEITLDSIAQPEHRRRVWECQSDVIRRMVEGVGGIYLRPPADAIDADGFLREEFRIDPSHGNAAYGELVLAMLEDLVRKRAGTKAREATP